MFLFRLKRKQNNSYFQKKCLFLDGPISYSIPQGDKRGYDIEFIDETFDGYIDNGTLKGNASD